MSIVAHYKMNDNAANTTVTDIINGLNGTAQRNTSLLSTTGKINQALSFNGTSDYVILGHPDQLDFTNKFSITMWVRPSSFDDSDEYCGLINKYNSSISSRTFSVILRTINSSSSARIYVFFGDPSDGSYEGIWGTTNNVVNVNTTYFITITYDGTQANATDRCKIYLNNSLQTAGIISGGGDENIPSSLYQSNIDIEIGRYNFTTAASYIGWIDDVRLFNDVLSTTERNFIYNSGTGTELEYYEYASLSDTLTLSDSWDVHTNPEQENITDTLTLDDEWMIQLNPANASINDTLTLSDEWIINRIVPINNAIKILHYNPLIFITNVNPVIIVSVDITDPTNPVKSTYEISSASSVTDIALNETNDYFYINVNSGRVIKINKNDLSSYSEINLSETDNLRNITTVDNLFLTFSSTDNSTGEIIKIDEREIIKFNSNLRWLEEKIYKFKSRISTCSGRILNTNLRWIANSTKKLRTNIRWLAHSFDTLNENVINYTNIQLKINDVDLVPLDDVDMSSISITHTESQRSSASFRLNRVNDDLDRTHLGVASQITNNNSVKIIVKGITEFDGVIDSISTDSENETVSITASMAQPNDSRHTVRIPMPTKGEKPYLYQCFINNVNINNPYVDPDDEEANNYKKGIKIDLGIRKEQNVIYYLYSGTGFAEKINDGSFYNIPNFTYFWIVSLENFVTNFKPTYVYIGTSLSASSSDTYKITGAWPVYQFIGEDKETELGYYYIGEAPYKEISCSNGQYITKFKYEDREIGLYNIKDEGYDYGEYAIQYASLEFEKLQNINGDILPITSANITLTIDAYYFYNIKLLTRIGVTNTTVVNTYNSLNGFPVAVKSITLNFDKDSNMSCVLQCDNQKSQIELDEIDERYPNEEDFKQPEIKNLLRTKYDIATGKYVSKLGTETFLPGYYN